LVVLFSNAIVEPRAVMIKVRNASIALLAMLCTLQDVSLTYVAKVFIAIDIEFYNIVTFNLRFSLKIDCDISWVYNGSLKSMHCQKNCEKAIYGTKDACQYLTLSCHF
jgi:hypothetical protein